MPNYFLWTLIRHNMSSISFTGPENENDARWFAISFLHDIKGKTRTSCFLSRLSEPQIPPTIDLNKQQASIFIKVEQLSLVSGFNSFQSFSMSGDVYVIVSRMVITANYCQISNCRNLINYRLLKYLQKR